jgi:transposase-like protein
MKSHPRDSQLFPEPRKPRVLRKRSAEERERLLALFERSGQSQKRFCREHEVALSTMTFWRRQARQSARSRLAGVLVEVPASVASTDSPRRVAPLGSVHRSASPRMRCFSAAEKCRRFAMGVTSGSGVGAPDDISAFALRAPAETSSRAESEWPFIREDFIQAVISNPTSTLNCRRQVSQFILARGV